jgi:hypothetical protein
VTGEHARAIADLNDARCRKREARPGPAAASASERSIDDCASDIGPGPTDAVAYYMRGWRHARAGEYERAIDDCTEAVRLDPHLPSPGDKYQAMVAVVSALSLRSPDGPIPSASALERIQKCATKLGTTGGQIADAGHGREDKKSDDRLT